MAERSESHEHQEDGDLRRPTDSPINHHNVGRRLGAESSLHRHGGVSSGDAPRRPLGQSVGSDRSIDRSPLNSSEASSHGLASMTPGRSRLRSVNRGDETRCCCFPW